MKNVSNIEKRTYRRQHCEWTKKVFKRPTKKHSPRDNRGCASSNNVSLLCGKQDLKSEAAVNNASFCIIWYKVGIESDKIDQYHTL